MREIEFRGKRIYNGEWVYGDICHHDGVVSYVGQHPADGSMVIYDLRPETVGQFTGFYDTINTKIYDGDIVDCEDVDSYGVVYWDNDDARYCILFNGTIYDFGDFTSSEIEVVSNIHDNPEMLEVDKK